MTAETTRLRSVAGVLVALALVATGAPWTGQAAWAQTQSFFVSFTDAEGNPVTDMERSQVFVETDGERSEALSLEPIRWPLRVTVFVDNGLASPPVLDHMREGLRRFVDSLPADIEVAIGTIGDGRSSWPGTPPTGWRSRTPSG